MSTGASWSASFGGATASAMRVYDDVLVPRLFEPWARLLIDRLELSPAEAVLDVACGPGSVARIASQQVGPGGRVTACDLSPAMLGIARAKPPVENGADITYLEAPADSLPATDGEFDAITCQQGLQFFPDRAAALDEMRRALGPGGRVGIAVWTEIDRSPPFSALGDAVEEAAGKEVADRYRNGPWGLPDGGPLAAMLERSGFTGVAVSTHTLPLTVEGGAAQLASTLAASGIAEHIARLSAGQSEQLLQTLMASVGSGPIESTTESNVLIARG